MTRAATLPYPGLTAHNFTDVARLPAENRWALLDCVLAEHGHQRDAIPDAWAATPLDAWCWLVLTINGLDIDPNHPRPLTHWGIDLTHTSQAAQTWAWALA